MRFLGQKLCALALLLAAGCGGGYDAYCEEQMDCRDGNDADIEACIIEMERQEEIAYIYGCEDDWDEVYLCLEERSRCEGNTYLPRGNDCVGETTDLLQCID